MDVTTVGRGELLHRLRGLLAAPRPPTLVLTGEPGVGKSHLARALGDGFRERGGRVDAAMGTVATCSLPLGALSHLLPPIPARSPDPLALLQHAHATLGARARRGPYLLRVDDAHALDGASATVVLEVVRRGEAAVLLTQRSDEALPDPIEAALREPRSIRIEVRPLDREQTAELVEHHLGGSLAVDDHARIWHLTGGNPLFVLEQVNAAREADLLTRELGWWRFREEPPASAHLVSLIEQRLAGLNGQEREAVDLLSLAEPAPYRLLEERFGADLLERLERRGLIRGLVQGQRTVALLAHPMHSKVVRDQLPLARRRHLTRTLTAATESWPRDRQDDAIRQATWQLGSGGPVDPTLALEGGTAALAAGDAAAAERLARAALAARPGYASSVLLGQCLGAQGRVEEAEAQLLAAEDAAPAPAAWTHARTLRAQLRFFAGEDPSGGIALLQGALTGEIGGDGRDELEATLALLLSIAGDLHQAANVGAQVRSRSGSSPRAVVSVLTVSSVASMMLGRFAEVAETLDVARSHEPGVRDVLPMARFQLLATEAMTAFYRDGHPEAALARLLPTYRSAVDDDHSAVAGFLGAVAIHIAAFGDDPQLAADLGREALPHLQVQDPLGMAPVTLAHLAYAAALRDDRDEATRWLDKVREEDERRDIRAAFATDLARVRLAALQGELDRAVAIAARRVEVMEDAYEVWVCFLTHELARVGATGPPDHGGGTATIEGSFLPGLIEHAQALRAGDADRLEAAAARLSRAGTPLRAAEAAVQAARAYRRAKDTDGEVRAALLAQRYASTRAGLRILGFTEHEWQLTERELQVARMAAEGTPDRAIAAALELSARTISNHLGRVYRKLDLRGRTDLATLFAPDPSDAPGSAGDAPPPP